jgi:hypothetical protein
MGNTVNISTGDDFTRVPFNWSPRIEYSLEKRVAVAYIATRANIQEIEWELVAADIVKMWGISKATVSKIMKWLESIGVIHFVELRRVSGDFPSKIYRIDRTQLEKLMTPPDFTVRHTNRHGSSSEPPRFATRTATVSLANLEEEAKEENNKKSPEEEEKSEILSSFNSASGSTPPKKSLEEIFDDVFGAVTSKEKKAQDLSASAAFPSDNPTETPKTTDTKEETNDSSACPAVNADNNNHPIPSARPEKRGELPVATPPRRSAVDELLSRPPSEQVKWLDAVEANESMEVIKHGAAVPMTEAFNDCFANM